MANSAAQVVDLTAIRERSRAHEREAAARLGDGERYLRVKHLAARWDVSETTVRDIPAGELPYIEVGGGVKYRHRRYLLADVERYERGRRVGEGRSA